MTASAIKYLTDLQSKLLDLSEAIESYDHARNDDLTSEISEMMSPEYKSLLAMVSTCLAAAKVSREIDDWVEQYRTDQDGHIFDVEKISMKGLRQLSLSANSWSGALSESLPEQ